MNKAVRYLHAGDLTTVQAHVLDWSVGEISSRYQEIALVDDRVVGSWTYNLEWLRGRPQIDSTHTSVLPRYQRKGVACTLWLTGIARFKPTRISATIGTDAGRDFLSRMHAKIVYYAPGTWLQVKTRDEDTDWEERCGWAAHSFLRDLGQRTQAAKQVAIAAKPRPSKLRSQPSR